VIQQLKSRLRLWTAKIKFLTTECRKQLQVFVNVWTILDPFDNFKNRSSYSKGGMVPRDERLVTVSNAILASFRWRIVRIADAGSFFR
jgi:hypothetical protein